MSVITTSIGACGNCNCNSANLIPAGATFTASGGNGYYTLTGLTAGTVYILQVNSPVLNYYHIHLTGSYLLGGNTLVSQESCFSILFVPTGTSVQIEAIPDQFYTSSLQYITVYKVCGTCNFPFRGLLCMSDPSVGFGSFSSCYTAMLAMVNSYKMDTIAWGEAAVIFAETDSSYSLQSQTQFNLWTVLNNLLVPGPLTSDTMSAKILWQTPTSCAVYAYCAGTGSVFALWRSQARGWDQGGQKIGSGTGIHCTLKSPFPSSGMTYKVNRGIITQTNNMQSLFPLTNGATSGTACCSGSSANGCLDSNITYINKILNLPVPALASSLPGIATNCPFQIVSTQYIANLLNGGC